jgi:hypothetical protein
VRNSRGGLLGLVITVTIGIAFCNYTPTASSIEILTSSISLLLQMALDFLTSRNQYLILIRKSQKMNSHAYSKKSSIGLKRLYMIKKAREDPGQN